MIDVAIAQGTHKKYTSMLYFGFVPSTAWRVSVFGVFLIRTFPHSEIYSVNHSFSPNEGNVDQKNSERGHFLRSAVWNYGFCVKEESQW